MTPAGEDRARSVVAQRPSPTHTFELTKPPRRSIVRGAHKRATASTMQKLLSMLSIDSADWLWLAVMFAVLFFLAERVFRRGRFLNRYYDQPIEENRRNFQVSLENQRRIVAALEDQLKLLAEIRDRLSPP